MKNKFKYLNIVFPNKNINLIVIFIIGLGIISGSIFTLVISKNDLSLVNNEFNTFINNINTNNINNIIILKNSLIENIILTVIIFLFGMSLIGSILNMFLVYLKSFSVGFIIASMFNIYKLKGFISGFIYLITDGLLNILFILIIGVYSLYFSINLFKFIFLKEKNVNIKSLLKKYFIIFFFTIILVIFTSLSEGYLFPSLIKLFIKVFI